LHYSPTPENAWLVVHYKLKRKIPKRIQSNYFPKKNIYIESLPTSRKNRFATAEIQAMSLIWVPKIYSRGVGLCYSGVPTILIRTIDFRLVVMVTIAPYLANPPPPRTHRKKRKKKAICYMYSVTPHPKIPIISPIITRVSPRLGFPVKRSL
jgi:hypothetical protein